jgi:hypothetical protein
MHGFLFLHKAFELHLQLMIVGLHVYDLLILLVYELIESVYFRFVVLLNVALVGFKEFLVLGGEAGV